VQEMLQSLPFHIRSILIGQLIRFEKQYNAAELALWQAKGLSQQTQTQIRSRYTADETHELKYSSFQRVRVWFQSFFFQIKKPGDKIIQPTRSQNKNK